MAIRYSVPSGDNANSCSHTWKEWRSFARVPAEILRCEFDRSVGRRCGLYAANSFQLESNDKLYLFMPQGVSDSLCRTDSGTRRRASTNRCE